MAKLVGPLNSVEAHGSIGPRTHRSLRRQSIVQRRTRSPNSGSISQYRVRAQLTRAARAWRALSPEVRAAWSDLARAGCSGFNEFAARKLRKLNRGFSLDPVWRPTPPAFQNLAPSLTYDLQNSLAIVNWSWTGPDAGWSIEITQSQNLTPGRNGDFKRRTNRLSAAPSDLSYAFDFFDFPTSVADLWIQGFHLTSGCVSGFARLRLNLKEI